MKFYQKFFESWNRMDVGDKKDYKTFKYLFKYNKK